MSVKNTIEWNTDLLTLLIDIGNNETPRLKYLGPKNGAHSAVISQGNLPLAEIRLSGKGNEKASSKRLVDNYFSHELKYSNHSEKKEKDTYSLVVELKTDSGDIEVTVTYISYDGIPVIRSYVDVKNNSSKENVYLQTVSSSVIGNLTRGSEAWWDDYLVHFAHSAWFREAQWQTRTLGEVGLDDFCLKPFGITTSRSSFIVSNTGTFSTSGYLPMGALTKKDDSRSWLWQIEHSGSWRWEIADYQYGIYLAAGGPTDQENQWRKVLKPGQEFRSVPVAVIAVNENLESAFQHLNTYRRRIRRPHRDNDVLPIIFNDYMNCLMGDPTTERVEALIEPAAKAGAEYFCIDCGWYANDGGWWDTVGEWEPSEIRFPNGLKPVLDNIRKAGMVPGLWLEPEVIGINSPIATQLPDEAFFCRDGQRVVEQGRFQLDFRHPLVVSRLDKIVDRLVNEFGAGYFKFDYNIDVTQGTDVNSDSPGDGMFEHRRAYIKWIHGLFDRHPDLVIESCSSGAQRLDYDLLAVHPLQSSSDQQDPLKYAAISASIPTALTPEQNAVWAYPQGEWSDELIAFTVVNSLLGRIHLSGRLDNMAAKQISLVSEGMSVYKTIRSDLKTGQPFWPLGLPGWNDEWLTVGIKNKGVKYLAVWKRGKETKIALNIPELTGKTSVKCLYPAHLPSAASVSGKTLTIEIPTNEPSARLFELKN